MHKIRTSMASFGVIKCSSILALAHVLIPNTHIGYRLEYSVCFFTDCLYLCSMDLGMCA